MTQTDFENRVLTHRSAARNVKQSNNQLFSTSMTKMNVKHLGIHSMTLNSARQLSKTKVITKCVCKRECQTITEDNLLKTHIPCSHYCAFLRPSQQRRIIQKAMRLDCQRLELEGMVVENQFVNQANLGLVGEKKYVIEASWWRKWCDYVNFT
jgi:hypothetical protein